MIRGVVRHIERLVFAALSIAILTFSFIPLARADSQLDALRELWGEGQYRRAARGLLRYQAEPYGKNLEVFYMIGTSLCRTNNSDLGIEYLDWILKNFDANAEQREVVEAERRECAAALELGTPVVIAIDTTRATASVSGRTKIYHFAGRDNAVRSVPVEVVRDVPRENLAKRLFPPSERDKAVEAVARLAGRKAIVESVGHFVLASLADHSREDLRKMGAELDRVFNYFVAQFGMRPPKYLITVYLVSSFKKVQKLSTSLHGIKVAPQSLGYSYRDDLSMIGYVPTTRIGTLRHELFHLMVRNNFGDIPPWMDEGLAALFEVAEFSNARLKGLPNWRGTVLSELRHYAPSVRNLVQMDWRDFGGGEDEESTARLAAIHAKARYLMLFLQEQGKLVKVYKNFQARDVGTDSVTLLEQTLEENLDMTEAAFQRWFRRF